MLKVHIIRLLPDLPVVELLRPNLGIAPSGRWTERYVQPAKPVVEIVEAAENADFLLLPHNYNLVRMNRDYIAEFEHIAEKMGKKIIIFFTGDSSERVSVGNALIFRHSQYASLLAKNEIILPGYAEDLEREKGFVPRTKSEKAIVGFCGWAGIETLEEELKLAAKSLPKRIMAVFRPEILIRQRGLWWRRRVLRIVSHSARVRSNFIIRRSYSGNEKTIELDTARAKREYVENISGSDFTLAIRGDGNFSTRFFEVLSLGRVPILLDTDCPLPLEDEIDYSKFILRIPWQDADRIDRIVEHLYAGLSDAEFVEMQRAARLAFDKYLRLDAYFNRVFTEEYLAKYKV